MDARPPKRLAQLRRVSLALVSTLQKHRSKLIRFATGSQHYRDSWVTTYIGSCAANLLKQKVVSQKNDIFATVTPRNNLFSHRLSDYLHCTNPPFTYVLRKDMSTLSCRLKGTPFRKNSLNEMSRKAT